MARPTSQFKGVTYVESIKKWRAQFDYINPETGKPAKRNVGSHDTDRLAADARDKGVYLALKEGINVTGDRTLNNPLSAADAAALDATTLQQFFDECKAAGKHSGVVHNTGKIAFRGVSETKDGKFRMCIRNPHERGPNGKMKMVTETHDTAEAAARDYDLHAIRFRGSAVPFLNFDRAGYAAELAAADAALAAGGGAPPRAARAPRRAAQAAAPARAHAPAPAADAATADGSSDDSSTWDSDREDDDDGGYAADAGWLIAAVAAADPELATWAEESGIAQALEEAWKESPEDAEAQRIPKALMDRLVAVRQEELRRVLAAKPVFAPSTSLTAADLRGPPGVHLSPGTAEFPKSRELRLNEIGDYLSHEEHRYMIALHAEAAAAAAPGGAPLAALLLGHAPAPALVPDLDACRALWEREAPRMHARLEELACSPADRDAYLVAMNALQRQVGPAAAAPAAGGKGAGRRRRAARAAAAPPAPPTAAEAAAISRLLTAKEEEDDAAAVVRRCVEWNAKAAEAADVGNTEWLQLMLGDAWEAALEEMAAARARRPGGRWPFGPHRHAPAIQDPMALLEMRALGEAAPPEVLLHGAYAMAADAIADPEAAERMYPGTDLANAAPHWYETVWNFYPSLGTGLPKDPMLRAVSPTPGRWALPPPGARAGRGALVWVPAEEEEEEEAREAREGHEHEGGAADAAAGQQEGGAAGGAGAQAAAARARRRTVRVRR